MDVLGNTGIVSGGHAGITPTVELNHRRDDNDNDWLMILVAMMFMGGRRGGFGDDCGGATPLLLNDNNNKNFTALQDQMQFGTLTAVTATQHSAQMEATRDAATAVYNTGMQIQAGFGQSRLDACNGFGLTNSNLKEGFGMVALENCKSTGMINQNMLLGFAGIQKQIDDCCCSIKMEMLQNKNEALKDKNFELQLGLSQCNQNSYLVGRLAPTPIPAYPATSPYQSFAWNYQAPNPGCGYGGF